MLNSPEPSLQRLTLPLAVLLSLGLVALLPHNYRLENVVNRAFARPLNPEITVVGIDDASLHDYGRIDIWPRELYAAALKTLDEAGAKVIGLDVLLSDPSPNDLMLSGHLSQPNVVLAAEPNDPFGTLRPTWTATKGLAVLNKPKSQGISEYQAAYEAQGTDQLAPSFARQVAVLAGNEVPLDTTPRLLPYTPAEDVLGSSISFRDVVNGNVRYADLQGRVVLVGLISYAVPELFPEPSVWSHFGSGYGYVPLVLPIIGLIWLSTGGRRAAARTRNLD